MQRWEYLTIAIYGHGWRDSLGRTRLLPALYGNDGDPTGLLNELGERGWELAGVQGSKVYLKRPRE